MMTEMPRREGDVPRRQGTAVREKRDVGCGEKANRIQGPEGWIGEASWEEGKKNFVAQSPRDL